MKLAFLTPLGRMLDNARKFQQSLLGKKQDRALRHPSEFFIRVPFIDYAAADGPAIGPGQSREWSEPCLLDPVPG